MIVAEKTALRREFRQARISFVGSMDAGARQRAFASLPRSVRSRIMSARVAAVYLHIGAEADPMAIAALANRLGKTICLPRIDANGRTMEFAEWNMTSDQLVPGPLGIVQPSTRAPRVWPDLIVTPLVAFDQTLARLGQGKGFYDRAFASAPDAYRLGLAWSVQQSDALPTEPWDIPLHAVLTELGLIEAIP